MQIHTICILGGSGFVGGHLVSRLYKEGYRLRVLTAHPERCKALAVLPGIEIRKADVHDPAELARQFAGMDAVINLVGILHEKRRGDFERAHVELPRKVVDACRVAAVKRLLHMSALGVSVEGLSRYQQSKGQGEALVRAAHGDGLQVTVLRPSVIYGRGDGFLNLFAELLKWTPVFPLGSPQAKIQPIFVGDVVRAFAASLNNPATFGQAYELCGPRVYTLQQLVEFVAATRGYRRMIVPLGETLSWMQAFVLEFMPVKMLTRDNWLTLKTDATCACPFPAEFGFAPMPLEIQAPDSLLVAAEHHPRSFLGDDNE